MQYVMKTRQENDVIDRTSRFYAETNIELSRLIGSDANYDKNQIGQHITNHTDVVYIGNEA